MIEGTFNYVELLEILFIILFLIKHQTKILFTLSMVQLAVKINKNISTNKLINLLAFLTAIKLYFVNEKNTF